MERTRQEEHERFQQALRDSVSESDKNWYVALILSFFGFFGLDRFYMGRPFLGIGKLFVSAAMLGSLVASPSSEYAGFAKLLTDGGCLIWWITDFALVLSGKMKDDDRRMVRRPR